MYVIYPPSIQWTLKWNEPNKYQSDSTEFSVQCLPSFVKIGGIVRTLLPTDVTKAKGPFRNYRNRYVGYSIDYRSFMKVSNQFSSTRVWLWTWLLAYRLFFALEHFRFRGSDPRRLHLCIEGRTHCNDVQGAYWFIENIQGSSVNVVTELRTGQSGFHSQQGQ